MIFSTTLAEFRVTTDNSSLPRRIVLVVKRGENPGLSIFLQAAVNESSTSVFEACFEVVNERRKGVRHGLLRQFLVEASNEFFGFFEDVLAILGVEITAEFNKAILNIGFEVAIEFT
jgi:hypothetical protein